jgi:type VI secretion system protein ImpK
MIDNPFSEPDDNGRTLIRPTPGGRRGAAAATPTIDDTAVPPAVAATVIAPRGRPVRAPVVPMPAPVEAAELPLSVGGPMMAAAMPLLQLLARLRNTLTPPDAGNLRDNAAQEVRAFEQRAQTAGMTSDIVRPAHYALCASLDDVVLNTPWGSGSTWDAKSLVSSFHHEVQSGERFFTLLKEMLANPQKYLPVLEIMYMCLSLGFMGRYRLSPRGPAEVDLLREEVYAVIAGARPHAEPDLSPVWRGVAAPYRPSRGGVPIWVAGTVGLAIVGGLFAWLTVSLNDRSDALYEQMLVAPPAAMPAITRAAPVQPPKPAPAAAEPGPLERLRTFLKPEVDAGLVEVIGTEQTPIVRISQAGMFDSGSATVAAGSDKLLGRIGEALKTEPGSVQVLGYTDNEPIRTARFPSNFQLSTARAEAAAAIVGQSIGDPKRITAQGMADADPIAANATPEGRAQNRRIEIVLNRQG